MLNCISKENLLYVKASNIFVGFEFRGNSSSYSNNRFHFLHVFRCHQSYLDALYLTEKEIENIFEFTMLTDR